MHKKRLNNIILSSDMNHLYAFSQFFENKHFSMPKSQNRYINMSDQTTISKIKYRKETVKVKIALSRE